MTSDTTRRALIGALPALAVAPAAAVTAGEPDPVFVLLARVREAKQEYDEVKALANRIWEANKARVEQEILAREPTRSCFVEAVTVSQKFLDEKCKHWILARSALASQPPAQWPGRSPRWNAAALLLMATRSVPMPRKPCGG